MPFARGQGQPSLTDGGLRRPQKSGLRLRRLLELKNVRLRLPASRRWTAHRVCPRTFHFWTVILAVIRLPVFANFAARICREPVANVSRTCRQGQCFTSPRCRQAGRSSGLILRQNWPICLGFSRILAQTGRVLSLP